nr:MAG TPA: hypothetical protein [Caudoviricetes sp.]
MYQEITLKTCGEGEKSFPFLATETTAYRYKQVFHQDLMILLNKMENSEDDQTDMTVGDKLAFIMNAQAEKRDMNKLNEDAFLEWADQFDGAELFLHMQEFVTLYLGSRRTSSKPKKEAAQRSGK